MKADPREWVNLAALPESKEIIVEHRRWLPKVDVAPAKGSAQRVLTYDRETDVATWEGTAVQRADPIPE